MRVIILLLVAEFFSTVIQRILCENTLTKKVNSLLAEFVVWGGYYVCINILTYFLVHNIWFNMAVSLTAFFLVVRVIYSDSLCSVLIVTFFVYLTGMGTEVLLLFFVRFLDWPLD